MDQIGSTSRLLLKQLNRDWESHLQLEASKERQRLVESQENSLSILNQIADCQNISLILMSEKLILNQELTFYANSSEENNSINTALTQLDDAEKALLIVQNSEAYKQAEQTYSTKRKENDLPLDGFREFIKSHSTRLTNRLAGRLTPIEKDILRQRKSNLQVAKSQYIILQHKALDIKF